MANRLSRSCAPGRQGARSPGLGQSGRRLPAAWNGGGQTTLARARPTRSGTAKCRSCFSGWESRARLACWSQGPDATISPRTRRCSSCGWPPTRLKWACAQLGSWASTGGSATSSTRTAGRSPRWSSTAPTSSPSRLSRAGSSSSTRRGSAWSGSGRKSRCAPPGSLTTSPRTIASGSRRASCRRC